MKKTSIIFIFCAFLLTACSTTTKEIPRQTIEATGTIEQVETEFILIKNDNIKIILTKDFPIQETSPAQIDPKYVHKIIRLNK
ncbi:hypothetical protein GGC09_13210 [Listeria monocytogenes]|nr:hypothetical protein [Listeria monocytogenes]